MGQTSYAPLWVKTNFSFLEGASHPEELVTRAHELGLRALAVTDRDPAPPRRRVDVQHLGLQVGAREHGDRPLAPRRPRRRARATRGRSSSCCTCGCRGSSWRHRCCAW